MIDGWEPIAGAPDDGSLFLLGRYAKIVNGKLLVAEGGKFVFAGDVRPRYFHRIPEDHGLNYRQPRNGGKDQ